MENNKEFISFFKNKLTRELSIYSIFDEIENEFVLTELFKLSCKYRYIKNFESKKIDRISEYNMFKDFDQINLNSDFKKLEVLYYSINKKNSISDEKKNKIYNILIENTKIDKTNLEVKKALISNKTIINQEKFIDFSEEKFDHISRHYFCLIDAKLNLKKVSYDNILFFNEKEVENKNIIMIDTIFKTSNIYLNIDISQDIDYLTKYLKMVKEKYKSDNLDKHNNKFHLLDKFDIKKKNGLLGDLLYIFDCRLLGLNYSFIKSKLSYYHDFGINTDTIKKYESIIEKLIIKKEFENILCI